MKRIFTDRGMGKTTALLEYAKGVSSVICKNGNKVYFVTSSPAANEFRREYKDVPALEFLSYTEFITEGFNNGGFGKNDEIIIDEAEEFMRMFGVNAYSLTIGGSFYENY